MDRCPLSFRFHWAWLAACCGLGSLFGGGCAQSPEEKAIAVVQKLGGKLTLSAQPHDRAVTQIDLSRTRVSDADLTHLAALTRLQELNLSGTSITDLGLDALRDCSGLKKLNLNLTKISDVGLSSLRDLPQLEDLYLVETGLTDGCVAPLSQLSRLKMLVLLRTRLGDAAVLQLRRALPGASIQIEPRRRKSP